MGNQQRVLCAFENEYSHSKSEGSEHALENHKQRNDENYFDLIEGTTTGPGCEESDIGFRLRADSDFGSFSKYSFRGSSKNESHRASSNPLPFVSESINQTKVDQLTKEKSLTDESTAKDKRVSSIAKCLQLPSLNVRGNDTDSRQPHVVVEQAGVVSISVNSFMAPGFSLESDSSSLISVPNDSALDCTMDESVEKNESSRPVSQNNATHDLTEASQCNDLVSNIELNERINIYFVFRKAGVVVIGNNSTISLNSLNPKESEDSDVKFSISPDDLCYIVRNDLRNFPGTLRMSGSIAGKRYKYIMTCMKNYQDRGLTQELEKFSSAMMSRLKNSEVDLTAVILLERALYFVYRKSLEDAKAVIDEVIQMATNAENSSLLLGRCHIFRAHVLLYEKKYKETLTCLDDAASFLEGFASGEDKAYCCYLYGWTYLKMTDETTEQRHYFETKALEYFEMEIQHAREDPEPRVLEKKMHYSLFKQISVYLRTYSKYSKLLQVDDKGIEKANRLLNHFDDFYYDTAPPATRTYYFTLRSDYFFRKKRFDRAFRILESDGMETA